MVANISINVGWRKQIDRPQPSAFAEILLLIQHTRFIVSYLSYNFFTAVSVLKPMSPLWKLCLQNVGFTS